MFTKLVIALVVLFALSLLVGTGGVIVYLICAIASWWFVKWLYRFKFPFWILATIFIAFPVTAWAIVHIAASLLGNLSSFLR